jgi:hypothetical protein
MKSQKSFDPICCIIWPESDSQNQEIVNGVPSVSVEFNLLMEFYRRMWNPILQWTPSCPCGPSIYLEAHCGNPFRCMAGARAARALKLSARCYENGQLAHCRSKKLGEGTRIHCAKWLFVWFVGGSTEYKDASTGGNRLYSTLDHKRKHNDQKLLSVQVPRQRLWKEWAVSPYPGEEQYYC